MYSTLVNKYGYTDIIVLYADGEGLDEQIPVHYSATQTSLEIVFNLLRENSSEEDFVFIFTTNHGGGFYKTGYKIRGKTYYDLGGQVDANGDEPAADIILEKDYNLDLNGDGDKFSSAINRADSKATKVNADTNGDGKISMVEAFNYARLKNTQSETPWYEDSGDGIPHSGKMPAYGEGELGRETFLE